MPIRTPSPFSAIFDNEDEGDEDLICSNCDSVGVHSKLQPRIYGPDEIDEDAELWRQCYTCGKKYPIYDARGQNKIKPFREPSNKFDTSRRQFETAFNKHEKLEPSYDLKKTKIKVSPSYQSDDIEINSFKERGAIVNEN